VHAIVNWNFELANRTIVNYCHILTKLINYQASGASAFDIR